MNQYINYSHLKFLLYEVFNVGQLCALDRFKDYDKSSFEILLDSTKDYADKEMFPFFKEMDENPARFEDGKIIVPERVGSFMKYAGETGAIGALFDYENGGMQLPNVINTAISLITLSANNHLPGYSGLTAGAANLILTFGNQELKDKFTPNMLAGKWQGTMCLTEPQAGSSLSDITTSAVKNDDGTYSIKGQKIFISGGDYEYVDNVVHLLLARIDGAVKGTKGISLFVVPKFRINSDESLESNDVLTAGDFQKMGQKGYCTTHLIFGENDNCKAYLVGEEHKGLKYMFQMMNEARINVGATGAGIASGAYYASLNYAKDRAQGRRIKSGGIKDAAEQTNITNHPDVRRMLMLQKAIVEGSFSILLQASLYHDLSHYGNEDEREKYHLLLELLTPIAKTYPCEMGVVAISNGLQVLGGYGFCEEYILQQYYRDIRITPIYEGTTGIQSLDLLGRKIVMKNGAALMHLQAEIAETLEKASTFDDLKVYVKQLQDALQDFQEVLQHLMAFAMNGENEKYIADANIFMEMASNIVIAWQWLKMASQAKTSLVNGVKNFTEEFYENKIHTMQFYFKYELPKISANKLTLLNEATLTLAEENSSILV